MAIIEHFQLSPFLLFIVMRRLEFLPSPKYSMIFGIVIPKVYINFGIRRKVFIFVISNWKGTVRNDQAKIAGGNRK